MSFGSQLRARREALKLSRADLARMLGLSPSAIGSYAAEGALRSPCSPPPHFQKQS